MLNFKLVDVMHTCSKGKYKKRFWAWRREVVLPVIDQYLIVLGKSSGNIREGVEGWLQGSQSLHTHHALKQSHARVHLEFVRLRSILSGLSTLR